MTILQFYKIYSFYTILQFKKSTVFTFEYYTKTLFCLSQVAEYRVMGDPDPCQEAVRPPERRGRPTEGRQGGLGKAAPAQL